VTTSASPETRPGDHGRLRTGLADYIRSRGTFASAAVEGAFRRLPRHLFLPGVPLSDAYAPKVVVTKRGHDGTAVSSASHPNLVSSSPLRGEQQVDPHARARRALRRHRPCDGWQLPPGACGCVRPPAHA